MVGHHHQKRKSRTPIKWLIPDPNPNPIPDPNPNPDPDPDHDPDPDPDPEPDLVPYPDPDPEPEPDPDLDLDPGPVPDPNPHTNPNYEILLGDKRELYKYESDLTGLLLKLSGWEISNLYFQTNARTNSKFVGRLQQGI